LEHETLELVSVLAMPMNKKLYEELQGKHEKDHRDAERERRWSLIRSGLACLVWAILGLVCYAFAFHTTDASMAEIYKWGAYVITYGGVSFTILRAYRKGVERGDW
jgi:hypothetical protein